MAFSWSAEQEAIINTPPHLKVAFVIAYAGCGKTTVLQELTRRWPQKRFLYLAFNKSIVKEARKKFSKTNTTIITTHSLAYQAIGFHYKEKLIFDFTESLIMDLAKAFLGGTVHNEVAFMFCRATIKTINAYLIGSSQEINGECIPDDMLLTLDRFDWIEKVLDFSTLIWNIMCDPSDPRVGMTHDGYMKLYIMTEPVLNYDYILVDEFQDTTPAVLSMIIRQNANIVAVGDPHQSIYTFRGAVNGFDLIEADVTHYLTTSWRFGKNVAHAANKVLAEKKMNIPLLKGNGSDEIISEKSIEIGHKPFMMLSRSTTGIFMYLMKLYTDEKAAPFDIHFVGGADSYSFQKMICATHLYNQKQKKIRTEEFKNFKTWGEYKNAGIALNDKTMIAMTKMVENLNKMIPRMCMTFKEMDTNVNDADILISSCHKAKGLESDIVLVNNDFSIEGRYDPQDAEIMGEQVAKDKLKESTTDEINLSYVAVTRAKESLAFTSGSFGDYFNNVS